MNPLDANPQPLHQMVPVLFVLSFILLGLLSLIGGLLNRLAKRPLFNGAYAVLVLLLVGMCALVGLSLFHPKVTLYGSRMLGQGTAALLPATVVSFFLGRRFSRKAKQVRPATSDEPLRR